MTFQAVYYLYILKNPQAKYYVGISKSLTERLMRHNLGRGAKYTAAHKDFELVFTEYYPTLKQAMEREKQLKKWSRAKKEALIAGDLEVLKMLSKSKEKALVDSNRFL